MKIKLFYILIILFCQNIHYVKAQLTLASGVNFNIQNNTTVLVKGHITSNADIKGTGKLILKGDTTQNVNMNGYAISNLKMDNDLGVSLSGPLRIGKNITFNKGKILMSNFDVWLAPLTTTTGAGAGKYFETNGLGFLRQEINAPIVAKVLPLGAGENYLPLAISNTGSTYINASIGAQLKGVANTNKHPRTESFLLANWPIVKMGITSGTTNAIGNYQDAISVQGVETDLRGMFWDNTNWSLIGGNQNEITNTVGATITANAGELYAMNKFVLLDSKVFLQGAFNNNTGLMDDKLRTTAAYNAGAAPTSNLIPTTEPYGTNSDYNTNTNFQHVANTQVEIVSNGVFNDQALAADNIVDWVFIELRTTTTPSTVIQTRAALLQRDGDIVDIDGISPVYFKNIDAANYIVSVKHRNHLAMAINPITFSQPLALTPNIKLDFSNPIFASNFLGEAGNNYFNNGIVNLMYAGNVNGNSNIRFTGLSNDKDDLLINILGNNTTGIFNGYSKGDINMNRIARFTGLNNDKDYLLLNILNGLTTIIKTQILP